MDVPLINERIDDIPVLIQTLKTMGVSRIIDEICPPHGNWVGLSLGEICTVWITYILSQGDHRLCKVQSWSNNHSCTLGLLLEKPVSEFDFTDDRLAIALEKLHDADTWDKIESRLNQDVIRVYGFNSKLVRFDCTTVSTYGVVDEEGLIRFGRSKDDPTNPQIKISMAILDSLGLPLNISVVPGNCADDPLYLPAIRKVRHSLQQSGLLYVGDCKMAAIGTRTEIAGTGDYYLMPLPEIICPAMEIRKNIVANESTEIPLIQVKREYADGEEKIIAQGFEVPVSLAHSFNNAKFCWNERRIFIQSVNYAHSQKTSLDNNIEKALAEIENLNRRGKGVRYPKTLEEAQMRVEKILKKHGVEDIVQVTFDIDEVQIPKRKHGNKPDRIITEITVTCSGIVDSTSYENRCKNQGWRVYATNMPEDELSLEQVVLAYRNQYRIEDMFHRLKGKPTSLYPMLLNRDDHIDGLVKLLSIALRCIVCIEKRVHDSLKESGERFEGIYEYNPKKSTKTPRAERILDLYKEITLTVINPGFNQKIFITELSELQLKTLNRMKMPADLYDQMKVKVLYG